MCITMPDHLMPLQPLRVMWKFIHFDSGVKMQLQSARQMLPVHADGLMQRTTQTAHPVTCT